MWFFRSSRNFAKLLGFTNTPPTILMRHYRRGALSDLVHRGGADIKWSSGFVFRITHDVGTGLKEMHEAGFAHCDIKPANILIDEDESGMFAVLSDFGISRIVSANSLAIVDAFQLVKVDGVSVAYAAPELLQRITSPTIGQTTTKGTETGIADAIKATDVYSFSMVCYEMTTRKLPWPKGLTAHEIIQMVIDGQRPSITDEVEQARQSDAKLNALCQVMTQCWTHDPQSRLQMKWVLEILDQVANSSNLQ